MNVDYLTTFGEVETEYIISKSRFISHLKHIESYEEGIEYVAGIKKKYSDATHNCYAVVGALGTNEYKFSDDGEPGGTAGQPILNVLTKNQLFGVVCVVTRYFGGIKLGAGGLVGAYTKATSDAVEQSDIVKMVYSAVYRLSLTYQEYRLFPQLIDEFGIVVSNTEWGEGATITFAVPLANQQKLEKKLSEITQGRNTFAQINSLYQINKR